MTTKITAAKITAGVGALLLCGFLPVVNPATAQAKPGDCLQTGFGGYCDGPAAADGSFQHCEGAFGFQNCYAVRPVDTSVDQRGWVPK